MDPENFLHIATQISKLTMFPYFFVSNCLMMCLYVKDDISTGAHVFSRKHPLACYLTCMVSIFGGQMMASFLLGEPILASFKSNDHVLLATGAWYFVFYMPFDVGYKICKFLPVKILLSVMKEVIRARKVSDGVAHAAKVYPNSFLIMIVIGTLKGNGSAFLKPLERLLRGIWTPSSAELMSMSFPTKASIAASVIFVIDKKTDLILAPHVLIYSGVCVFFVYFKLSSLLLGIHDPFVPFENLFCALFFGGVWDALARLLTPANKGDQTSVKSDASKNGKAESAKKKE